jgi:2-hydroxy-3-oxopropionate reductase
MVGGKEEVFNKVKDIQLAMGSSAVLCGDIGAGNVTKLVNQVIIYTWELNYNSES